MNSSDSLQADTFTIIGRCERTGMLGLCLATCEIATGSRASHVKAMVGAVATQAFTNPYLGKLAINLLKIGYSAHKVLEELKISDTHIEYRQIGVMDRHGHVAVHTGNQNSAWAGHIADNNYIAMGNLLANQGVVKSMVNAFKRSAAESLEERLLCAIEAGRDAGGQLGKDQNSAALIVYDRDILPRVDLRVDWHDVDAITELRRHLEMYKPLIPYYIKRPFDPTMRSVQDWLQKERVKSGRSVDLDGQVR